MATDSRITLTIPDKLPGEHTPLMQSLLELPRIRPLEMRQVWADSWRQFNWQVPGNRSAAIAQVVGQLEPVECESCMKGKGPFEKCVTVPGQLSGGCGNCRYLHGDICSLRLLRARVGSLTLSTTENPSSSGPAGTQLLKREKLSDDDLGDEIETIIIDTDSDGQSSSCTVHRRKRRRQLEQPRRRRRLMRVATSSTDRDSSSRASFQNRAEHRTQDLDSGFRGNYTTGIAAESSQDECRAGHYKSSLPITSTYHDTSFSATHTQTRAKGLGPSNNISLSNASQVSTIKVNRGPQYDHGSLLLNDRNGSGPDQHRLASARDRYTTVTGLLQALRIVVLGSAVQASSEPRTGTDPQLRVQETTETMAPGSSTLQNHSRQDLGASVDVARHCTRNVEMQSRVANQEALNALFNTLEREMRLLGADLNAKCT